MSIKNVDNFSHKNFPPERKQFIKYVGVLIDERLSWKTNIDFLCNKICRMVVIFKLRHCLPTHVLITMSRSMIHPLLLYGISIWGQASKLLINILLVLQKRALRSIFFKKITESAIPLLIENNILPVTLFYLESISHLMIDVVNNNAPLHIQDMFISLNAVHTYNTRSRTSENLFRKFSRLEIQFKKRIFSRVGVNIWNKIPEDTRKLSKFCFKNQLETITTQQA